MQKKLLVLLIAVVPALMPNLASAVAIDVEDCDLDGCTGCFDLTVAPCQYFAPPTLHD